MLKFDEVVESIAIYYSQTDACFVAESSLWTGNIGVGDTPDEARAEFIALLETGWPEYEAGNHAMNRRKLGRPATGKIGLNARIAPEVGDELDEIAKSLGCYRSEVIEALVRQFGRRLKKI